MPVAVSSSQDIPNHSIRIAIDRGGTFTDVFAWVLDCSIDNEADARRSWPETADVGGPRKEIITKLLSQDPSNYRDAPTEGIRRILEIVTGAQIPRGSPLPTEKIGKSRENSFWTACSREQSTSD